MEKENQYNQMNTQQGQGGYNQGGYNQGGYNQNSNPQGMYIDQNNMQPLINRIKQELQICQDPIVLLSESQVAYVRQKPCLLEVVSGYDTQNIYDVYSRNKDGNMVYLFKCKEDSGCCERMYCRGDSKPFKLLVKHITNPNVIEEDFMNTYAVFDRPFKCTCCCLERPKMKGYYQSMEGKMFGSVSEPWTCYDPMFLIKDMNKEPHFQIRADCCQCGLLCRNSCGKCSDIVFPIYPANCEDYDIKNSIGMIKKVAGDFVQELVTEADNFEVLFPQNASPEEKLLLIGATLMIDYRYFEDTTQNSNGKVGVDR